ncbi:hypothetical protein [Rhodanobacter geophilus]|uniref:Uncharacterized protein n=1 Tax=Rhodanobacter geophilus TaxID=3162488 RepID=A0ABV3QR25_9GAMM
MRGRRDLSAVMANAGSARMKKIIFDKCYAFSGDAELEELLAESLDLYADAGDREPEVNVRIGRAVPAYKPSSINPRVHETFERGMLTSFPTVDVYWERAGDDRLEVDVVIKPRRGIRRTVHKLLSMEYPREAEAFEQILHEFVLVPSVYFFKDVVPIHAASVAIGGSACLLAGTGGAGKSSAMLALRDSEDVGFVSDDIVVMSDTARVNGNMAWPKIYGYNCVGNAMKSEILAGRGWIDRAHFNIKNHVNSANVRRKMSPDRLYSRVESASVPLSRLYYVVRENVPEICVSELDLANAVEMTIAVISAEYSIFHDHLYWEKYNALATGRPAMLTMEEVTANWRRVLTTSLATAGRFKISVPFEVDHAVYQDSVTDIVVTGMAA